MCDIVQFLLNTVIIVSYFVPVQNHVFMNAIITGQYAIFIPWKLRFGVCHRCYCLLIYDDYVILLCFYLKPTNSTMLKLFIVKGGNGEIKKRIDRLVSHKYRICSFVLYSNTIFLQHTKQSIIFKFWSLPTSTATKIISQF